MCFQSGWMEVLVFWLRLLKCLKKSNLMFLNAKAERSSKEIILTWSTCQQCSFLGWIISTISMSKLSRLFMSNLSLWLSLKTKLRKSTNFRNWLHTKRKGLSMLSSKNYRSPENKLKGSDTEWKMYGQDSPITELICLDNLISRRNCWRLLNLRSSLMRMESKDKCLSRLSTISERKLTITKSPFLSSFLNIWCPNASRLAMKKR